MIYFADTSAILNGVSKQYNELWISPLVMTELEKIKNSERNEHIKYLAREAVRDILFSNYYKIFYCPQQKVNKLIKKYKYLSNINDHHLLCEALILSKEQKQAVTFITSDGALALFARLLPNIQCEFFQPENKSQEEYCGWRKFNPSEIEMSELYSHPENNILRAQINEFCEIYEHEELKDILRWTGEKYAPLKYQNFKNNFLNKKIQPLNLEQKMAFDLLQNSDITVKILVGAPGTGKDYLMLLHALDLIQKGLMDKIIFIRNLVPFKDAPEIGFLAGDLQQKIAWGLGPISSILGEEGLMQYEEQGIIEAMNLGFIRGCSWDRTILYVSEGQNITGGGYKLLVSRCGKGSQLWVNGDILQTDNEQFEKNNGLYRLCNSLQDNPLVGIVKLLKTERSETANLASII